MKVDRCSSCDAPMLWALSLRGKRMPFDAEPKPSTKNAYVFLKSRTADPIAVPWSKVEELFGEDIPRPALYHSHFGSCPNADTHRQS